MLPRPTAKYAGLGPLTLARMTHEAEDAEDDIKFLAIQDAVYCLPAGQQEDYRRAYIDMMRSRFGNKRSSDHEG